MYNLISVIVPVYNVIDYLEKCVHSICAQTYKDIEIILVDDGSNDGSEKLCDELAKNDNRIVVIHKENGGSTAARNEGLKAAKGVYIGFVDSDDWIEPDMYESLLDTLLVNNADVSVGRQYIENEGFFQVERKRSIVEGVIKKTDNILPHHIIYSDDYSVRGISPNLWDKLFKNSLIMKHQMQVDEKTKFAEDDLCVYSCLLDADVVAFIDKPIYHYCKHTTSVTHRGDELYFEKITLFYTQMKKVFEKSNQSELLIKKLNRYMVEFILRGLNNSFVFPYGTIVPFFIPPYNTLNEKNAKNIVLYGAGDVGKDYYRAFNINPIYNIVCWVDKRYDELTKAGFDVVNPESINEYIYDVVLIATDSQDLVEKLRDYLIKDLEVDSDKIVGVLPTKFIETLDD